MATWTVWFVYSSWRLSGLKRTNHVCFRQHHGLVSALSPSRSAFLLMSRRASGSCEAPGRPRLPRILGVPAPREWQAFICALSLPLRSALPGVLMGNGLKTLPPSSFKTLFLLHHQSVQSLIDQFTDKPSNWEEIHLYPQRFTLCGNYWTGGRYFLCLR